MKGFNLEAYIFSLSLQLLLGNFLPIPESFLKALSTELLVKIGLILLGSGIIFGDILKGGGLGLAQAVVLSVGILSFWLCRKMGIDKKLK